MPLSPSLQIPPKGGVPQLNELIDLALAQLTFASDQHVSVNEKTRLVRAAVSLLTAYLGEVDHAACWRRLGEVVARVVEDARPQGEAEDTSVHG